MGENDLAVPDLPLLVEAVEHELHDRKEIGPVDVADDPLVERLARFGVDLPCEVRRACRTAHGLGHVRERRRREVIGGPLLLEAEENLVLQELLVEIGAQGRDDPDPAGRQQLRQRARKARACVGTDRGGEELVELVDQHDQIAARRTRARLRALLPFRDLVERGDDGLDRDCVAVREQRRKLVGRAIVSLRDLREGRQAAFLLLRQVGRALHQCMREGCERPVRAVAGPQRRHAPHVHCRDHARRGQARHQTGARKRRLAGAARADDDQERGAARARLAPGFHRAGNVARTAEEHGRMLRAEGLQARIGRALRGDRPGDDAAARELLPQPFTQQTIELRLEIVGRGETLKCCPEVSFGGQEPAREERLEPLPLPARLVLLGGIVELHQGRIGTAKHEHVGEFATLLSLGDGGEHLIGGAARIRRAVRHVREVGRQLGAEPLPEDRDHQIAVGGRGDLGLECVVGAIKLGLPAHGLEPRRACELAIEPRHHPLDALTLELRVARG